MLRARSWLNRVRHLPWADRSYRRRMLDADLMRVGAELTGDVLEIGAGRQRRRGRFRPPVNATWICVDRARDAMPDVVADVRQLPFRSSRFDAAVCLEVLEYLPVPLIAVRELARLLRPGGVLVFSMPFVHRWDTPDDRWRLSPSALEEMVRESGLVPVSRSAQGGALAAIANVVHFVVHDLPGPWITRALVRWLAMPVAELLYHLDGPLRTRSPNTRTLSTGYLVVARRR